MERPVDLIAWWKSLGEMGKRLVFWKINQKSIGNGNSEWARDVERRWKHGSNPSQSELRRLKEWTL